MDTIPRGPNTYEIFQKRILSSSLQLGPQYKSTFRCRKGLSRLSFAVQHASMGRITGQSFRLTWIVMRKLNERFYQLPSHDPQGNTTYLTNPTSLDAFQSSRTMRGKEEIPRQCGCSNQVCPFLRPQRRPAIIANYSKSEPFWITSGRFFG